MVQSSIKVLRNKGYRVTRPRRQVLEVLETAQRPLSPYDIQKLLWGRGKHLDHVTIYRVLDLFCTLNLAHKILSLGGFVRCALGKREGCHRFMVCRNCGAFREFADKGLCAGESEITQDFGFHAEQHLAESLGLCSGCSSSLR